MSFSLPSAQAAPGQILSGNGSPVTGVPGFTTGNAKNNGSMASVEEDWQKLNMWRKKQYDSKSRVPISDPSGGGGGGSDSGNNRATQSGPTPPEVTPSSALVPPHPTVFQQPQGMATTTNGSGASAMTQTGQLPITNKEFAVSLATAMEQARQNTSPTDKIPSYLVGAETLKQFGSKWIGDSAQLAFGAGVGSIAGTGSVGGGGASGGDGGELDSLLNAILGFPSPGLINIANEASGTPTVSLVPFKTIPQAVWMVQQMYKHFSVPLAILLLLPGAVITQLKAQVAANFNLKTEDATSPFEGILRAMVAVFLIPASQLIVSYSIDVGNSLAYSVNPAVSVLPIIGWVQQVAYSTLSKNSENAVLPPQGGGLQEQVPDGGGPSSGLGNPFSMLQGGSLSGALGGLFGGGIGGGLAAGEAGDQSVPEQQAGVSSTLQTMFNVMIYMFSIGMLVMTAFQLTIMCYLYLLGPVAAAFFAWPTVKGKIFRPVFGNWTNAVITVSLWRFYWMVILAIMTNRLMNLGENGSMLFNLQWEVAIFTCLIGLLFYAPMNPWQFDPGQAYRVAKYYGESIMQAASKAGGGGGGGEGGGGGGEGGGEGGGGDGDGKDGDKDGGNKDGGKDGEQNALNTNPMQDSGGGRAMLLAETSGSEARTDSSTSQDRSVPTTDPGGNSEPPPLQNMASTGPEQQPNASANNNGIEPPTETASASPTDANSRGNSDNAQQAPIALSPPTEQAGGQSTPAVAYNPAASSDAIQAALQENYGEMLNNAGAAELPPASTASLGSNSAIDNSSSSSSGSSSSPSANNISVANNDFSPNTNNKDDDKPPTGGSTA